MRFGLTLFVSVLSSGCVPLASSHMRNPEVGPSVDGGSDPLPDVSFLPDVPFLPDDVEPRRDAPSPPSGCLAAEGALPYAGPHGQFGEALALTPDATRAVVGASYVHPGGAAYVFRCDADGTWRLEGELVRSVIRDGAEHGHAVAISDDGSIVAVSAPEATFDGPAQGEVRVYARSGTTWAEESVIVPPTAAAAALVGWSLSLSADAARLAIGAPQDFYDDATGSVFVYARSGTSWLEEARLRPMLDVPLGHGWAIALSADGNVVAASVGDAASDGAVSVYRRLAGTWTEDALFGRDGVADQFGSALAISADGGRIAVGGQTPVTLGPGVVRVFSYFEGLWDERVVRPSDDSHGFGVQVALDRSGRLLVASSNVESATPGPGRLHVFDVAPVGGWSLRGIHHGSLDEGFGYAIQLEASGTYALVGAPGYVIGNPGFAYWRRIAP